MTLGKRMQRLQELFRCRVGPGSAILPRDVTKIQMTFSTVWVDGHLGPRRFWKEYLPRLKYHNPAVNVTVSRVAERGTPAEMIIYFAARGATGSTKASPATVTKSGAPGGPESAQVVEAAASEQTKTIDIQHSKQEEIYKKFLEATGAQVVQHTPEESAQLRTYEEQAKEREAQASISRQRQEKILAEQKAEEMARQAAAAAV